MIIMSNSNCLWAVISMPGCVAFDLTGDGIVDLDDINEVLYNSIFVGASYNNRYDLIVDGIVDIADIFEVAIHFGEFCPCTERFDQRRL